MTYNRFITKADDLITSKEQIRTGFINFALEKNRRSSPYIAQANFLKQEALKARNPMDLLKIETIQSSLLTASGLSDKSLKYFNNEDKLQAVNELIKKFLIPAGANFVDELVYRFLLIKGDSLGGSMRNIIGTFAEQKLKRYVIACLEMQNIHYRYKLKSNKNLEWQERKEDLSSINEVENQALAISWIKNNKSYILAFNLKVPIVDKNIDILLFNADYSEFENGAIVSKIDKFCMLGELKGGIDPAGADEHWKTANSALNRIRQAFLKKETPVLTSFLGAAIEKSMANEIFDQLESNELSNAANFSNDEQLQEYCLWLTNIKDIT
ncbi:AvaI/BsoBI family type II restriction endonuclease [Neisseria elongata]|uniref:AvaI/BsoBI family type II restriction endonuclease n=1 Tax=Neisseria elongata TaxID=495 RepID=UPI000665047C|nr:AvaI/BsoBI family type II restriction endonuclease [Neisseria elongata]